ncbi:MAG: grxD [Xanthomonadaceae bacterium]|nr:grxD [Xanthomonadaceae bacterium]
MTTVHSFRTHRMAAFPETAGTVMPIDDVLRERIASLLGHDPIVLFMKGSPRAPQCGFSARTVAILDDLGVDYAHVDVLADAAMREGIKLYSDWPTIPQLYIGGQLLGGSDIVEQMLRSGELHAALGLPAPDRTPPSITITPAAVTMLRSTLHDAGNGHAVNVTVDARFATRLQLGPADDTAIALDVDGLRVQFDPASARRAEGLAIDWVDDERGRGLVVDHPRAAPAVRPLSPLEAASKLAAASVTLVDVRPPDERAFALIKAPFATLDQGPDALEALPRETPLAFLCHHGQRSAQAAEHFRQSGFLEVYNVTGGIDAWAQLDPSIPRY